MISLKIYNSNGGALEYSAEKSGKCNIVGVFEPDAMNAQTIKTNFPEIPSKHTYIGAEKALDGEPADVIYVNVARKEYAATESAVPIVDKNAAGSEPNGVLVMKNAFRMVALQEPEMFIVESGIRIHAVAMEAFSKIPGYYIRQVKTKRNVACGMPIKKETSFIIGTKRSFTPVYSEAQPPKLTELLVKGVDYGELPAYAKNRLNGKIHSYPCVIIDPDTDNIVPNIMAHYAKDNSAVLVNDNGHLRPLMAKEIARLKGFEDWYEFSGNERQKIRQIADSIGVGAADWIMRDIITHYFECMPSTEQWIA